MMTQIGRNIRFWIFLFLASCSPTTVEDLRCEGRAETRKLTALLRTMETKEDVQRALPRLKKHFNQIADLIVETRAVSSYGPAEEASSESFELFQELARLYSVPGGRELLEMAQQQALLRLQPDGSEGRLPEERGFR